MLSELWARVTGKDKGSRFPDQQAVALGRAGDYTVIFPYGHSCNLPDDALLLEIGPGMAIPVTVARPADAARGEVALFHPSTNSRIIFKNDKRIEVNAGSADVDVYAGTVNVHASQVNLGDGGAPIARQGDAVEVNVTYGSSFGTHTGTITGGGGNTSI